MTYSVKIENGVVVNRIIGSAPEYVEAGDDVQIGWLYDEKAGSFIAPSANLPDPLTVSLSKRQINAALILSGVNDPDSLIEAAIATIADDTQRALALNDWRYAPYYERNHALFNDPSMLSATNLTAQQVNDLWTLAAQQLT